MITFWWVRHAPTHEKTFVGWRDVPADVSDTAALARLDAYLPREAAIISSDLSRCVATADAIQGSRQRLLHDPDLREFHFGDWDGKGWQEVAETHPDLSRAYWTTPGDPAPPGGESWYQAEARIARAVARLRAAPPSPDVIVAAPLNGIRVTLRLSIFWAITSPGVVPCE
ncbi:MAG: histidine phosphatase family protein, partial [Pseudomonadota bacterium]